MLYEIESVKHWKRNSGDYYYLHACDEARDSFVIGNSGWEGRLKGLKSELVKLDGKLKE